MIWTYVAISPDETYADTIGELCNQWQGWEHMNLLNVVVHVPWQDSVTYWLSCPSMFLCLVFICYSLLALRCFGAFSVTVSDSLYFCSSVLPELTLSLSRSRSLALALALALALSPLSLSLSLSLSRDLSLVISW